MGIRCLRLRGGRAGIGAVLLRLSALPPGGSRRRGGFGTTRGPEHPGRGEKDASAQVNLASQEAPECPHK
jgi:hypothetical protein